jgi:AraC-like DNA-binding protein
MAFKIIQPSAVLKPYVSCYFLFQTQQVLDMADTVYPSGVMEMIFNLGDGSWESMVENEYIKTPPVELWGQLTKPLNIRCKGRHTMLGVRLYTHTAAYFLDDEPSVFNNQISDLAVIGGNPIRKLHARLQDADSTEQRIALLEAFLIRRLMHNEKKNLRVDKVADILSSLKLNYSERSVNEVAISHGISSRYLHKLVFEHTGLSPKLFNKINRFQHSLLLIAKGNQALTSIAYECGYFDQSHFIRDFRSFTGITPSEYFESPLTINAAFLP